MTTKLTHASKPHESKIIIFFKSRKSDSSRVMFTNKYSATLREIDVCYAFKTLMNVINQLLSRQLSEMGYCFGFVRIKVDDDTKLNTVHNHKLFDNGSFWVTTNHCMTMILHRLEGWLISIWTKCFNRCQINVMAFHLSTYQFNGKCTKSAIWDSKRICKQRKFLANNNNCVWCS